MLMSQRKRRGPSDQNMLHAVLGQLGEEAELVVTWR